MPGVPEAPGRHCPACGLQVRGGGEVYLMSSCQLGLARSDRFVAVLFGLLVEHTR